MRRKREGKDLMLFFPPVIIYVSMKRIIINIILIEMIMINKYTYVHTLYQNVSIYI